MDNDDDAPPPPEETQAGEQTSNEYYGKRQISQHDSADFGSVAPNQDEPKSPPILPPSAHALDVAAIEAGMRVRRHRSS